MARRYLLSLDGGGIRGVLPACALAKLEAVTGKLARETFSFAAGTSTGALLSAAVAAGLPATKLLDIYLRRGREIFSPRAPWNTVKRLATGSMYSNRTLHRVLVEELGAASVWRLNDSPIDLMLTAKGLDGRQWYFVKDKPANSGATGRLGLIDCATASASAPTFFGPWEFDAGLEMGPVVDGSVGVTGNPVYQACVEAFYYTGEYSPENTLVVSLGTGRFPHPKTAPRTLYGWLNWTLGELLRSPGEQQTEIVERHFREAPLYRLDPDLMKIDSTIDRAIEMDDVEAIPKLIRCGQAFAELIDWEAILAGSDETFRVTDRNTNWQQYKKA
ncbi:MAG TPA: patatin-like phospholipase family protein [Bryobacteraceae bacterium]|nr:patatin-like phospholipase family protein [Bryobacteraceae bacterium]